MVATLALVNMIFRGDGSSNIVEGNSLDTCIACTPDKVLMNPPFALQEYEWRFVDKALDVSKGNALLFAILPTSTMGSSDDRRGEIAWRQYMLERHRLVAVIKMPQELFKPVAKGTYGVVIQAHRPHDFEKDKVVFAIMDDGVAYTKTQKTRKGNMEEIKIAVMNYLASKTIPTYVSKTIDCCSLKKGDYDLTPEKYIGYAKDDVQENDWNFVQNSLNEARIYLSQDRGKKIFDKADRFLVTGFFSSYEKGGSGRNKDLRQGDLPLISTSEERNGISSLVDPNSVKKTYPRNAITISSNGGCCCAFFHDYEFAANGDVFVCQLKSKFDTKKFGMLLCSAINSEKWRFNYYRKFNKGQLNKLKVSLPVDDNGEIDLTQIKKVLDTKNASG